MPMPTLIHREDLARYVSLYRNTVTCLRCGLKQRWARDCECVVYQWPVPPDVKRAARDGDTIAWLSEMSRQPTPPPPTDTGRLAQRRLHPQCKQDADGSITYRVRQ